MRNSPHRRHTRKIEGVTRMLAERTKEALAQDYVVIALCHDVFRCEQPFFECCSHSSLQQDRQLRSASSPKERKVLHATSADLNDVAMTFDQIDMRFFERFGDDLQVKRLAELVDDFPAFLAQALKSVRGTSGLPHSAAKEACTALLHGLRHGECLVAALNRAWARDNGEFVSSDGRITNSHDCLFGTQIKCDQLVRLGNPDDFSDACKVLKTPAIDRTGVAGDADRCPRRAWHWVRAQPNFLDHVYNCVHFLRRSAWFHYDQHSRFGLFHWCKRQISRLIRRRESQRPVGKRSLFIATTRAPTRRQAAFEGLSNKQCRRSSPNKNNDDLADVEFDFVWVTTLLPNRKSKLVADAAVRIAVRDTGDKHVAEKIDGPFLNPCCRIVYRTNICTRINRTHSCCACERGKEFRALSDHYQDANTVPYVLMIK